jgi:hypothetical protein
LFFQGTEAVEGYDALLARDDIDAVRDREKGYKIQEKMPSRFSQSSPGFIDRAFIGRFSVILGRV